MTLSFQGSLEAAGNEAYGLLIFFLYISSGAALPLVNKKREK